MSDETEDLRQAYCAATDLIDRLRVNAAQEAAEKAIQEANDKRSRYCQDRMYVLDSRLREGVRELLEQMKESAQKDGPVDPRLLAALELYAWRQREGEKLGEEMMKTPPGYCRFKRLNVPGYGYGPELEIVS